MTHLFQKIRRAAILASAALLWIFGSSFPPAWAQQSNDWTHNRSIMSLDLSGDSLTIRYFKPRRGLQRIGIVPGTLLFDGKMGSGGDISGFARVFRNNCDALEYPVSGRIDASGNVIELSGPEPIRKSDRCEISHYSETGPNSNLVFEFQTGVGSQSGQPQANSGGQQAGQCGWYAVLECGKNRNGLQAQISRWGNPSVQSVNTSDPAFPNFRSGFYCAMIGPQDKSSTYTIVNRWKQNGRSPSAYAKRSC